MTLPCETVRDLIPLAQDEVASPQSKALVDEHIAGCEDCRAFYASAGRQLNIPPAGLNKYDEAAERKQVKRLGKRITLRRRSIIIAVSVVLLAVLLPYIFVLSFAALIHIGGDSYSTTDVSQYGVYEGHISSEAETLCLYTKLALFPKAITEQYKVDSFYYYCSSQSLDTMYQIYLSYTLPPEDFRAEIERFDEMHFSFDGAEGGTRQYDDVAFNYPAYVLSFREKHSTYEYALVDEANCRIICVYSLFKDLDKIPMDAAYLPQALSSSNP